MSDYIHFLLFIFSTRTIRNIYVHAYGVKLSEVLIMERLAYTLLFHCQYTFLILAAPRYGSFSYLLENVGHAQIHFSVVFCDLQAFATRLKISAAVHSHWTIIWILFEMIQQKRTDNSASRFLSMQTLIF